MRASLIASLALALAAPLGVAWAQPPGEHQHDSRGGASGHQSAPPEPRGQAPRGAGTPAPHAGGGAPNGPGHFSVAPRLHAPARPGNAPPAQSFRPAPQSAPRPSVEGPAVRGSYGGANAGRNFGRGEESNAHGPVRGPALPGANAAPGAHAAPGRGGPANGFAGGSVRPRGDSGRFANDSRDPGQRGHGFASNPGRPGGFDAGHGRNRGLAFGHPVERHYDRDHWQNHRHWDGGYWNGRYWPAIHDRVNFVWLLPTLPVGYVTYSWDGVPYYYYNDTYYAWDPGYGGYVATEPPPVADSGPSPDEEQEQPDAGGADPDATLYAYPAQGQSPEQQAQDRQECQQWAASQSPEADDSYQRALKACLTGRGYSVD